MKNYKRYNKFVINSNAPVVAYGHTVIRMPYAKPGLKKKIVLIFRKAAIIRGLAF